MKKYAPILILLAGCLWGTMGLFVRKLNAMGLSSMEIVEIRSVISVLVLFPFSFLKDRSLLKIRRNQLWPLVCSGLFSIVFFNYCYFSTIALTDLSIAAILLYTAPIFVMLLSLILFQEKLTIRKLIALVLAFGGCCLVSGIGTSSVSLSVPALLLGLGSGIGYALYSIFSRFSLNLGLRSFSITDYTFLFAALGGIAFTDFGKIAVSLETYGFSLIAFAVLYTVVTTILPYLLYTTGLQYTENGAASVMASIEPVVATILGVIVFSETPSLPAFLGILLVLGALLMLNLPTSRKKE